MDGCGVVVVRHDLERMARAYSRFAVAAARGEEYSDACLNAMGSNPFLVGGTDRIDSAIISETEGRVVSKVGAEGVHCALLPDRGIGLAIKVQDGAQRAQVPRLAAFAPGARCASRSAAAQARRSGCASR